MAKENSESCGTICVSSDSEGQDDTLEAEISRLQTTLSELDDDLSEFSKCTDNNHDSCEEIEKTITNSDWIIPVCKEVAELDNHCEKYCSPTEPKETCLYKPLKNEETDVHKEVLAEVFSPHQSKAPKCIDSCAASASSSISNKIDENGSKGGIATLECEKAVDSNTTSSEYLSIYPSIDSAFETLLNSPFTSNVEIIDPEKIKGCSHEFSPFSTLHNKWYTSSPKVSNSEDHQQLTIAFPSVHNKIQNAIESSVSLHQHKYNERDEEDFSIKTGNLGISKLQNNIQKIIEGPTIQHKTANPIEDKLGCLSDNESLDSVILLEEPNFDRKLTSESFLDLDISQDYENEWLAAGGSEKCDNFLGPVSSTPCRKGTLSLTSKHSDFHLNGSFIVLDETGEVNQNETENKIPELPSSIAGNDVRSSDDSAREVKCEPKNVELDDHQELNISVKCTDVVVHPSETVTVNDIATEHEVPHLNKKDEDYVEIQVIKSDYLFKSEDPAENADNFDPEWELLRKLQTDEERYKAMRERWRNLVIPDPNLDLTHYTWRLQRNKTKKLTLKDSSETQFAFTKPVGGSRHKRTLSDPSSSSEERTTKRSRTQSCTTLFDVKLEQLRQEIGTEQHRLFCEEAQAMEDLRNAQAIQKVQLQSYYHGYQFMSQLQNLQHEYLQNEEMIRLQYKGARYMAESSQEKKINSLKKASAEVQAFHRFYQGLENKEDNDTSAYLSETQLEELWETEHFYEECEKFYT